MKGNILYVIPDDNFGFKGAILAEDGEQYRFNKLNWINKALTLDDIHKDAEVEFEKKEPNKFGVVYPQFIRFAADEPASLFVREESAPKHSHGSFQSFVYLQTEALLAPLSQLIDDTEETLAPSTLFQRVAVSYNALADSDFIFSADGGEETVIFPSGFVSKEGKPVYLYCVPNHVTGKSPWYCNRLFYENHLLSGSLMRDLINANWYELVTNLKELLPTCPDDPATVVRYIQERCMFQDISLVWLKDGVLCSEEEADHLYAPTGFELENGKELYLYCAKHGGIKGYGWYYECLTYEDAPLDVYDKKAWLELWSSFDWKTVFSEIEHMTLEEHWSFAGRNDYGILRNYLIYTFAHQWQEGGIAYSADRRYAAFNTGLPERATYKYIYAFYERIEDTPDSRKHPLHMAPQYRFLDFVIPGRGGYGKQLQMSMTLPNPPRYFSSRSATVWELDFNDSNQITMPYYDDTHILIFRGDRLPLDFFRCAEKVESFGKILNADVDETQKFKNIREYLMPYTTYGGNNDVDAVFDALHTALQGVIEKAVKRLSWNWRAVVPCYNPEQEKPCFLLPVSFCDMSKPDRAMIASANEVDGKMRYSIHTVIPLEWAYLDARLVCRPESEWLAAESIG